MGYQENCEAFALHGCTMREHYDHEENSYYDQFDGQRGDVDPGGYEADFEYELQCELQDRRDFRDSMTDDNCVDCRDFAKLEG